jgi:hypothetical protein
VETQAQMQRVTRMEECDECDLSSLRLTRLRQESLAMNRGWW